ncbi:hypothetical protein [Nocardia alni]|uniref:hypothetical protein n=1 Tax=Nocardia alni TaxID=2815723 RepID=UPI001C23F03C|nr:hypothetical protein [Nocardia alni]
MTTPRNIPRLIDQVDRIYREVIRTQITVAALAAREGVSLACDDEVDDVIAARS